MHKFHAETPRELQKIKLWMKEALLTHLLLTHLLSIIWFLVPLETILSVISGL